jgi:tetratricopeptide (TPR) repeat protein
MQAALMRNDGRAVVTAAGRLPDYKFSGLLLMRGRGELLAKDYAAAERSFRRAILDEREIGVSANVPTRSPLVQMRCHFHLGQVYEATGKRDQAIAEYREFLSRFEGSPTRLPQVAEARAALKRLGAP